MSILDSLFGSNTYLGIDIGTSSIKIAEISKDKGLPRLKNYGALESYGYLERVNNAIQTSSLRFFEKDLINLLSVLLKKINTKTKTAVASLPSFSIFSTLIEMPVMSEGETQKAMTFQARQYIPMSLAQATLDWVKVGEKEVDGVRIQEVFLIAVTNEVIKKYQKIFQKVGLKLIALECESLALVRSTIVRDSTPTLIVDIGAKSTNIVITEGGLLKYNSQTDFAGANLTQSISGGLGISPLRAEELKKRHGLLGKGGEYELSTLMTSSLDAILNEVVRAKNEYKGRLERIVLAGGGAKLLGIDKYFESQLNLPVVKVNPFDRVSYPPEITPIIKEIDSSFSVAIGLGIRQFI